MMQLVRDSDSVCLGSNPSSPARPISSNLLISRHVSLADRCRGTFVAIRDLSPEPDRRTGVGLARGASIGHICNPRNGL